MIARKIDCVIERRLLVSYRIDPDRVDALLPRPFRPQLVNGHAVGGVCFIRMSALRPAPLPRAAGLTTENVAHWFAVEWDDEHGTHAGVYVPRRDTSSRITATLGASMFPGAYQATGFFRHGALGFSPSAADGCLDGVHLHSTNWAAQPMIIMAMSSSLFDDAAIFPSGTCAVDSALLMTNITAR